MTSILGLGLNSQSFKILFAVSCKTACHCSPRLGIVRSFSLNHKYMKSNSLSREAKFMSRLIDSPKKKRKLYFEDSIPVTVGKGPKLGYHGGKENSRRMSVLNSVFMKHISDLLMTGNMAGDILDKNLEISRVAMAPTFNQLNIFWSTNSEENANALEAVLPEVAFSLRHELSQLRVMGNVPKITFVRDNYLKHVMKVDYLLGIADYGDDHVPLHQGSEFKNGTGVGDTVVIGKPESLEDEESSGEELTEDTKVQDDPPPPCETMPQMRHDIFNLDHALILSKITKSLKKSRAVHRFQPNLALESEGQSSSPPSTTEDNMTKEERKTAMAKFILSRKILIGKRSQNKYNSELNVGPSETRDEDYDYEYEDFKTEDYIIEDYLEEDQKFKQ